VTDYPKATFIEKGEEFEMISVTEKAHEALLVLKPDDHDKVAVRFFINMEGG
jgi:hypothetical protein